MSSTQRSESMHSFFNKFLTAHSTLIEFVKQYDSALASKVQKEEIADFHQLETTIHCISKSPIEKQFQAEYTHSLFREVQTQFSSCGDCHIVNKVPNGSFFVYYIMEDIMICDSLREKKYEVIFDPTNFLVKCQCLLFEYRGIICRHSLSVLGVERVKKLPNYYILQRWSKNVKRRHSNIKSSHDSGCNSPRKTRYEGLCKHLYDVAERACQSHEATDLLHHLLSEFDADNTYTSTTINTQQQALGTEGSNADIRSPIRVKRKGRPQSKRKVSSVEKAIRKTSKSLNDKFSRMTDKVQRENVDDRQVDGSSGLVLQNNLNFGSHNLGSSGVDSCSTGERTYCIDIELQPSSANE